MYKNPKPTVDIVILDGTRIVLVKRGREPFKGKWVFPGGFIDHGETAEHAAVREAKEETGMDVEIIGLLGVYSSPDRDPRDHHLSIVFIAKPIQGSPLGGDDADEAKWHDLHELRPGDLAFDHDLMASDLGKWIEDHSLTFWSTRQR